MRLERTSNSFTEKMMENSTLFSNTSNISNISSSQLGIKLAQILAIGINLLQYFVVFFTSMVLANLILAIDSMYVTYVGSWLLALS